MTIFHKASEKVICSRSNSSNANRQPPFFLLQGVVLGLKILILFNQRFANDGSILVAQLLGVAQII